VLKNHAAETYGLVEVQFLALLTLALAGGKWSSSCCVHFTPRDIFWFVVLRRLGEPQKNHSRQIGKEKNQESNCGNPYSSHRFTDSCLRSSNSANGLEY
jgi:hypothetical protein